jgi:hypothetical protein
MKQLSHITIVCILIVSAFFVKTARWDGYGGVNWKDQFGSGDAKGYYAYLPQLFLKHDLSHQDPKLQYVNKTGQGYVNKYFTGTAVFWSPFFGLTTLYNKAKGQTSDGYTASYKKMISVAALFWLLIALLCLAEVLKMMKFSPLIASLTLLLIYFGTNLFFYSVLEPTMSHLYSFTALSALLCFGLKYFREGKNWYLFISILSFGLGILLRPTNVVWMVCLLPFLAGGLKPLREAVFRLPVILMGAGILFLIASIQCGAWYLQTGHWFLRPYAGEGFYFFHPELFRVLFGFQKGWLVYTPMAALAILGFIPIYKRDKTMFYSFLALLCVFTYTIAAWWSWTFADSFGHRAFIDLYPVVAILLAFTLNDIPRMVAGRLRFLTEIDTRFILRSVCFVCMGVSLIQTYQFYQHILHYNSMDWKRYKYVFLKTAPRYIGCLGGCVDLQPYSRQEPETVYVSNNDFSKPLADWNTLKPTPYLNKSCLFFNGEEYGATLTIPADSKIYAAEKFFVKVDLSRYEPLRNSSSEVMLVANIQNDKHENEYYSAFAINDEPSDIEGDLRTFHYSLEIPGIKDKNSKLILYLWNKQRQVFYLTDLNVEIKRVFP